MNCQKLIKFSFVISLGFLIQSCTSYSTSLNGIEKLQVSSMSNIRSGKSCSKNLFGGFTLPYFGDTAIKLSGDESVVAATKEANITRVYAIDKLTKNYIFYSKRCTTVFGN